MNGGRCLFVSISDQEFRISGLSDLIAAQAAFPDDAIGATAGNTPENSVPEFGLLVPRLGADPDTC